MNNLSLDKQLLVFINEAFDKRVFVSIVFAIISIMVISTGVNWPKIYESNTSILWTKRDPISALVQQQSGGNQRAHVREQVEIAKGVILSNKILDRVIKQAGLNVDENGKNLNNRQIEVFKGGLRKSIQVFNTSQSVIQIAYRSSNPELAFLVVSIVAELFLQETRSVKNQTSQSAFDFINRQVIDYKSKLDNINRRIIEFRKSNVDLDSDTRLGVNSRVNSLKLTIRNTSLDLKEAKVQKKSIEDQLISETNKIERQLLLERKKATSVERESAYSDRLKSLQSSLDTLRLSYTDNYPDIIQLQEQIKNLKVQISEEKQAANTDDNSFLNEESVDDVKFVESVLFARLSGDKSNAKTLIQTLQARVDDTKHRLDKELLRASKVNTLESQLEELTRDLTVTQSIYDDLLTRRENARVALNLQLENQNSTFKTQDPATFPLVPIGLRFLHFVLGCIPFGLLVPFAMIFGFLFIDGKIRHEDSMSDDFGIPVIGVIEHYSNELDKRKERIKNIITISIFSLSLAALVIIALLKINQFIGM